jgi:hypothetical protein
MAKSTSQDVNQLGQLISEMMCCWVDWGRYQYLSPQGFRTALHCIPLWRRYSVALRSLTLQLLRGSVNPLSLKEVIAVLQRLHHQRNRPNDISCNICNRSSTQPIIPKVAPIIVPYVEVYPLMMMLLND